MMSESVKKQESAAKPRNVTLRSFIIGALFSGLFAVLTTYQLSLTATQIPVLPYVLLIVMVLLLNPLCRLIRFIRSFGPAELIIIFIMGAVSSGISTFGFTAQLIPIAGSFFNPEWNTRQSEWNLYVVPFVNNEYFLSDTGRGIQESAVEYHDAATRQLKLSVIHDTAVRYVMAENRFRETDSRLRELEARKEADTPGKRALETARITVEVARRARDDAEKEWEALREEHNLPGLEDVLEQYPRLIESARDEVERAGAILDEMEREAFERVTVFRRGLPRELSAYPGFFPMPGDNSRSYFGRMRRLAHGKAAVASLKRAVNHVEEKRGIPAEGLRNALRESLGAVLAKLEPLTEMAILEAERDSLRERADLLAGQRINLDRQLRERSSDRRKARRTDALAMDREIRAIESDIRRQTGYAQKLRVAQERNERELICAENARNLVAEIERLKDDVASARLTAEEFTRRANSLLPGFVAMDASLRRYFIGEIPWSQWALPLAKWGLLAGLTYLILMSFNVLIFRQWAHNEKLTYPLAELPKTLVGGADAVGGVPDIFGNGLFWAGFTLSGIVLGWNLLCWTELVPGLQRFDLNNFWWGYVNNTQFHALRSTRSMIFFTMIGLAFLIPKNISFSLWFFHVLYMVMLLFMVWGGHGQDDRSFPADWLYLLNFRTALGQGAIMVFSSAVLYKCRKYILCAFTPSAIASLDGDEQRELKTASFAFVFCSIALILILWKDMGANLYYVVFSFFIIIFITIGLVRAVTEGGILGFQAWVSPFHFIRAFFGLDKTWTCTSLFAPIMIYYSVFFLDIKTFIAPAMANAVKLRDDFRIRRGQFHFAVFVAIIVAAASSVIAALLLCYAEGADSLSSWFYTNFPRGTFEGIKSMIKDGPSSAPSHAWWVAGGGAAMAALLYFRQIVFWLPHPLGLVMFVNPIMGAYWFSILIGWLCNTAVTKYGNKNTYKRASGFFIGLIVGELFIITLGMVIALIMDRPIPMSLNRN